MKPELSKLFGELEHYRQTWLTSDESIEAAPTLSRYLAFLRAHPDAAERSCRPGHLTGSALVVSRGLDRVLLHLHKKLGIWIQLGGHADGSFDLAGTALREAREESGMEGLHFLDWPRAFGNEFSSPTPFDLDIHVIPTWENEPAHEHFDARYLLVANEPESFRRSEESLDLKWLRTDEAFRLTSERSMHRQFEKLQRLRHTLIIQPSGSENVWDELLAE